MKYLLMVLAVVMIFAGPALAYDGNVSHDMLAKMGLSGMQVMSDAQGTSVRGMGGSLAVSASAALIFFIDGKPVLVAPSVNINTNKGAGSSTYSNLTIKGLEFGRFEVDKISITASGSTWVSRGRW